MAYFSIPYFNELTANQLGFTTEFNPYTPANSIADAFTRLNNYFQQPQGAPQQIPCPYVGGCGPAERVQSGSEFDRIMRIYQRQYPNPADTTTPQTPPIAGGCPSGEVPYKDILGISHCGKPMTSDGKDIPADDPTHSGKKAKDLADALTFDPSSILKSDTAIGAGLIILAVILGIIGIISLR